MSEIIKTEAVVLSKMDYRDTSNIISLYTKDFGKLSAILKGGRSPKSKKGYTADPPNHIQVVLYKKDTRELQLLSSADLITHFSRVKENLEKLKYTFAILELVKKLVPENEENLRLFNGLVRIFNLLDSSDEKPKILFGRFFLFFLKEIGYEVQLKKCASCGKSKLKDESLSYNFDLGILCIKCSSNHRIDFQISQELFNYLICLKQNNNADIFRDFTSDRAIVFLERYLSYLVPDFKGFQAFKTLK
jgi:DNA repair protein RecO (recombination protein O)